MFLQISPREIRLNLNLKEVQDTIWIDFRNFCFDVKSKRYLEIQVLIPVKFKIFDLFLIHARAIGMKLSDRKTDVLWGITMEKVQELVLKLDKKYRNCRKHHWIYLRVNFPFNFVGYLYTIVKYFQADSNNIPFLKLLIPTLFSLFIFSKL